jgi:hypothetical protein
LIILRDGWASSYFASRRVLIAWRTHLILLVTARVAFVGVPFTACRIEDERTYKAA